MGLLREGKLIADRPAITGLLQLLDGLRSILKNIEAEDCEGAGEDAALIERLEELQAPAKIPAKHAARLRAGVDHPQTPSGGLSLAPAGAPAPHQAATPPVAPAPAPAEAEHEVTTRSTSQVQVEAASDAGKARGSGNGNSSGTAADSTLRVDVALLNRMMNLVGELVLTQAGLT